MSGLQVLELTTDRHLACMMDTACGGAGNTSVELTSLLWHSALDPHDSPEAVLSHQI